MDDTKQLSLVHTLFSSGLSRIDRVSNRFFAPVRPDWVNFPNRDYWLAAGHRKESLEFLSAQGYWFGCLLVLLVSGLHWALLVANRSDPPVLPMGIFVPLIGGFVAGFIAWLVVILRRFRKPQ